MGVWNLVKTLAVGALVVAAAFVPGSSAHGFIASPAARVTDASTGYCPHCLPAGGPGVVYANGRNFPNGNHGVCGDDVSLSNPPRMHEGGGNHYKVNNGFRMTYYQQGGRIPMKIAVSANHGGYFQISICAVPPNLANVNSAAENSVVTEGCFSKNNLQLTTTGGGKALGNAFFIDAHQIPSPLIFWTFDALLPPTLTCDRCVIRWHWVTANSCNPPGLPQKFWSSTGMNTCGQGGSNPEEFWNCADIGIVSKGKPVPAPKNAGNAIGMNFKTGTADGARGVTTGTAIGSIGTTQTAYTSVSTSTSTGTTSKTGGTTGGTSVGTGAYTPTGSTTGSSTFPIMPLMFGVGGGCMTALPVAMMSLPLAMMVGMGVCVMVFAVTYGINKSKFTPASTSASKHTVAPTTLAFAAVPDDCAVALFVLVLFYMLHKA